MAAMQAASTMLGSAQALAAPCSGASGAAPRVGWAAASKPAPRRGALLARWECRLLSSGVALQSLGAAAQRSIAHSLRMTPLLALQAHLAD